MSSSTDWQAAFGFGSSKQQQQEDDLGFDPFDITRRALADLIEKELSVEDSFSSSLSTCSFPHRTHGHLLNKGLGTPGGLPNHLPPTHHFSQHQHPHRGGYSSFSLSTHPSSAASSSSSSSASCMSSMGPTSSHNNFVHLNHTVSPAASTSHSSFLDLTGHPKTGLGGIPISGKPGSVRGGQGHLSCTHIMVSYLKRITAVYNSCCLVSFFCLYSSLYAFIHVSSHVK